MLEGFAPANEVGMRSVLVCGVKSSPWTHGSDDASCHESVSPQMVAGNGPATSTVRATAPSRLARERMVPVGSSVCTLPCGRWSSTKTSRVGMKSITSAATKCVSTQHVYALCHAASTEAGTTQSVRTAHKATNTHQTTRASGALVREHVGRVQGNESVTDGQTDVTRGHLISKPQTREACTYAHMY